MSETFKTAAGDTLFDRHWRHWSVPERCHIIPNLSRMGGVVRCNPETCAACVEANRRVPIAREWWERWTEMWQVIGDLASGKWGRHRLIRLSPTRTPEERERIYKLLARADEVRR